jgi:hypothetical protein
MFPVLLVIIVVDDLILFQVFHVHVIAWLVLLASWLLILCPEIIITGLKDTVAV